MDNLFLNDINFYKVKNKNIISEISSIFLDNLKEELFLKNREERKYSQKLIQMYLEANSVSRLEKSFISNEKTFYIAETQNKILGAANLIYDNDKKIPGYRIKRFHIKKEYQKLKIGTLFLDYLIEDLRNKNEDILYVHAMENATNFFKKYGFIGDIFKIKKNKNGQELILESFIGSYNIS